MCNFNYFVCFALFFAYFRLFPFILPLCVPCDATNPPLQPLAFLQFFVEMMDSLILRTFVVHDLFATVHILFTTLCKNLRRILFFECKQQFLIEIKQQFFLFPVLNDDHRVVWNVILIGGIIKLRQSDPAPVFAVLCHSLVRFGAVTSISVMSMMCAVLRYRFP